MLHATLPPAHPWPGMSHPGPELLLQSQVRAVGDQAVVPHRVVGPELMGQLSNLQPPQHQAHQLYAENMCQQQQVTSCNQFASNYNNTFTNINNVNINIVNNHQPASLRPVSRQSHEGNLRHASGGSHSSSHRATPPSPDDLRSHSLLYKQNQQNLQIDRASRTSFDQCNTTRVDMQASPSNSLHRGNSPRTLQRMPPSPAAAGPNIPQKMPYDLTTPIYPNNAHLPVRTESVISSTVLMPTSTYQQSLVNVKKEPGSPAHHYAPLNPANRAVKQEPNLPHSPGHVTATPSPTLNSGYPANPPAMERNVSRPSFNYPSPQSSNPISPASTTGDPARPSALPGSDPKFRYHNNSGGKQNPSPSGESTCNSAISSREGTPGPRAGWSETEMGGLAPNVDITRVQVKEELVPRMGGYDPNANDYNRRPSVNLSYPAAATPARSSASDIYSGGYTPNFHTLPQQVSIPHRNLNPGPDRAYRPSVGRPPMGVPGNSEVAAPHSNVKIGRRPAHLPKVLKFEDHTLPPGWQRKLKQRKHGKQAGRWDVYIYSPCGVKFASRKKLKHFFEKNNLQYDAEQFDFTPYGKHIENAPQRHLSSASSEGNRASGSPGSVHSPSATSYHSVPNLSSEFISPASHLPPTAHHAYMPPHPAYEFNPMMESPPNTNAREIQSNQILNLSQTTALSALTNSVPRTSTGIANFPSEIDDILNENAEAAFRNQRGNRADYDHLNRQNNSEDENGGGGEDGSRGREETERGFMTNSINILSDANMDMSMDMYNVYHTP